MDQSQSHRGQIELLLFGNIRQHLGACNNDLLDMKCIVLGKITNSLNTAVIWSMWANVTQKYKHFDEQKVFNK